MKLGGPFGVWGIGGFGGSVANTGGGGGGIDRRSLLPFRFLLFRRGRNAFSFRLRKHPRGGAALGKAVACFRDD